MRTVTGPWGTFRDWDLSIVGNAIQSGQFWDQQIQPALDEADPHGWAIDLGANIGWFTVYLARRGHPMVVSVEAHPQTFQLLQENVRTNGVAGSVLPINVAAYDQFTNLCLAPDEWLGWPVPDALNLDQTTGPASIAFVPGDVPPRLTVPGVPIDALARWFAWPRVSVIKVDCQGADLRAMVGLSHVIECDRPIIVFEWEGGFATTAFKDQWEDYVKFFWVHHYQIQRIREDLWDYVARPL